MPRLKDEIELPDSILVREVRSGMEVAADIVALDRQIAKNEIDLAWWAAMCDLPIERLRDENDKGWQWHKDVGTLKTEVGNRGYAWAAKLAGRVQGAILYEIGAASALKPTEPTLMVYRLATAPWNRAWLRQPPEFTEVGSSLLRFSVYHSYKFGLGGRVTLEAYPDEWLINRYMSFGFRLANLSADGINVGAVLDVDRI